jgi:hypothetical protein
MDQISHHCIRWRALLHGMSFSATHVHTHIHKLTYSPNVTKHCILEHFHTYQCTFRLTLQHTHRLTNMYIPHTQSLHSQALSYTFTLTLRNTHHIHFCILIHWHPHSYPPVLTQIGGRLGEVFHLFQVTQNNCVTHF